VIRFAFRWLFRLLVVAIVAAAAAFLAKDILLREWALYRLRKVTGLETHLDSARAGLFTGTITLTDLRLYNSAEFGGGLLISVPDLHLEIDGDALPRRELRLKLGRLHIDEFNVVRNREGRTNIFELMETARERAGVLDALTVGAPGLEFTGIETLNLTLGTARFIQIGDPRATREFRVGVTNEIVHDVRSTSDLTPLLLKVVFREIGRGFQSR